MIETIVQWDKDLFNFFNHCCYNGPMDFLMYWATNKWTWVPLYAAVLVFIYTKFKKKTLWIVLAVALMVASTDMISTRVFKNNVKRLRPCQEAANLSFDVRTLPEVNCSKYGFVSSHAANSFGLAVFVGLLFYNRNRKFLWIGLAWASFVSFSRLYLGVHYPLDLLGGALLGAGCALLWFILFKKKWGESMV
jgi:undecaprenyl-diphosphatase